jgi:uncharacterized protein (TIGR00645 family)
MLRTLARLVLASRFLLVVFLIGLLAALALYAMRFLWKLVKFAERVFTASDNDALVALLYVLDAVLVASLVVTVAIASYDTLVARLSGAAKEEGLEWSGNVEQGNLKIKLGVAIVAISSIHLLQLFFNIASYSDREVFWSLIVHASFLLGILTLGLMDWMQSIKKRADKQAEKLSPPGDAAA